MKTLAIISEYNPFHNGHLYMLEKSKELTGSDYAISLMSGNFTQRGNAAVCDKFTRAKMSVLSGIDLCLELPFVYASGSAYDFANGAIGILDSLNSVDYLCFGAECDDICIFDSITDIIADEPDKYKSVLKDGLKSGLSYPYARQNALTAVLNDNFSSKTNVKIISDIISKPNNILAIEYLSALKRIKSGIKPIIIRRNTAGYNDETIYNSISSAQAIRKFVFSKKSRDEIVSGLKNDMPEAALNLFADSFSKMYPLSSNALLPFIQSRLINPNIFPTDICDMSSSLANKISKSDLNTEYNDFIKSIKTKDITESRINRVLLHLVTDYKNSDRDMFYNNKTAFYASILAFKKSCTNLLKEISKKSRIPIITKKSDFKKYLSDYPEICEKAAERMWELDITASSLYGNLIYNSLGTHISNDFVTNIPII